MKENGKTNRKVKKSESIPSQEYRSFDEYKKRFFPVSTRQERIKSDDPYESGVSSANESLNKMKQLLQE